MENKRLFIYDRKEVGVLILLGVLVALFAFTLGIHLGKKVGPKAVTQENPDGSPAHTVSDQTPNRQELTEQGKNVPNAVNETLNQAVHDEVAKTGVKLDTARQVDLPQKTRSANGGATTLSEEAKTGEAEPAKPTKSAPPKASSKSSKEPAQEEAEHGDEHGSAKAAPEVSKKSHAAAEPEGGEEEGSTSAHETVHSGAGTDHLALLPALARKLPNGRYTLQVGSYPSLDEAKEPLEALESHGMKPVVRAADIKANAHADPEGGQSEGHTASQKWYRVFVGGFESKDQAEKAGAKYKREKLIENFIVARGE